MRPRVAVVIVQYGAEPPCVSCLRSLAASEEAEAIPIVADNSPEASDALRAVVESQGGLYLHLPENLGYAGAANRGMRAALTRAPDVIAIANPDVRVAPDCLRLLADRLRADPRIGIVGPGLLFESEPGTWWNAGSEIVWPSGKPRSLRHGTPCRAGDDDGERDTDYACGALLAIRPELLGEVGLIPEHYFLYFEDADYCFRARRAGYRVVMDPRARAWHRGGGSTESSRALAAQAAYYRARNRLHFSRAWCPRPLAGGLSRMAFGIATALRALSRYARSRDGGDLLPARAVLDYARGRTGRLG